MLGYATKEFKDLFCWFYTRNLILINFICLIPFESYVSIEV